MEKRKRMKEVKMLRGQNIDETWQLLQTDLNGKEIILEYNALLETNGKNISFSIDVDPGGGFESGYTATNFTAPLSTKKDLHLSIHKEGLLDEAGKLFGMQDVVIGYPEFDKKVIIKTNDEPATRSIFSSEELRAVFAKMKDYMLKVKHPHHDDSESKNTYLELIIENEVPGMDELKKIYESFYQLLVSIDTL